MHGRTNVAGGQEAGNNDLYSTPQRYYKVRKYPAEPTPDQWVIGSKDDYGAVLNKMHRFIEDNVVLASEAGTSEELLAIYEQNELLTLAAAVAFRIQREDQAIELVECGLDRVQKIGPYAYKNQPQWQRL